MCPFEMQLSYDVLLGEFPINVFNKESLLLILGFKGKKILSLLRKVTFEKEFRSF